MRQRPTRLFLAGLAAASDLYREYDPTRPPGILTAPPVRSGLALPHVDADPEPPGTTLTLYRIAPEELQIGVLTAALGAPWFVALVHRRLRELA